MPQFYLSPSRIARYFYHECERYLRYHATPRDRKKTDGVPDIKWDTSPVRAAILEGGFTWEREIIEKRLKDRVRIAQGKGKVHERAYDISETLKVLPELRPGEAIYQPTLQVPDMFLERYGISPELCEFPPCRPDLVQLMPNIGEPSLKVIDIKASTHLKISHRIQVATYALMLRDVGSANGLKLPLDLGSGGIWLYGGAEPEWFDMRFSILTIEEFFREKLKRILSVPVDELAWHLFFRCEWCEFFAHCKEEAESRRSISLIPYLSIGGRTYLREAPWDSAGSINTLDELERFLEGEGSDVCLDACGSLRAKGDRLRNAVAALKNGEVLCHGGFTLSLPVMENVAVFITVQEDPVTGKVYAAGFRRFKGKEVFGDAVHEEIFIAKNPDDCDRVRKDFLTALFRELSVLHKYNSGKEEWAHKKSMQAYVFDSYELALFSRLLKESLADPGLSEIAVQLLFHFQDTTLAEADEHPDIEVPFPIIVITGVIRQLLALPVPLSLRLPDVLKVLGSSKFDYKLEPSSMFWFELSNVLKSDPIFLVWTKGRMDALDWIRKEISRRLQAAGYVLDGLRERVQPCLFAWPLKFAFSDPLNFSSRELSRLAFIARYESLLSALEIRMQRGLPWPERIQEGISIPVRKEDFDSWKVLSELDSSFVEDAGEFFTFILVPAGEQGERDQMGYDDYRYRKAFYSPANDNIRLARIYRHQVDPQTGNVTHLSLELKEKKSHSRLGRGYEAVIHPRFTDANVDRIIERLYQIDRSPNNEFLSLIRQPRVFARGKSYFHDIAMRSLKAAEASAGFTRSQTSAFNHVLKRRLSLVWGPPGTGKTHFLAKAILSMAKASLDSGKALRIAVTAFTHAAIENLLVEIREHAALFGLDGELDIFKLKYIATSRAQDLAAISEKEVWSIGDGVCVIGGTIYSFYKTGIIGDFPMLVVDEASQMKFGELAMAWGVLAPGGSLVLAGDDLQLPPIMKGAYPEAEDGLPGMHNSIFAYLRARDDQVDSYTRQLTENWRMNNTLSEFPAETLYGQDYQPANENIGSQRISFRDKAVRDLSREERGLCEWIVEPEYPMTLCVLEGIRATVENRAEAELVAMLAKYLREKLINPETGSVYPDSEKGDGEFWRKGLFIVSPHHAQIRAIRRELSTIRRWRGPSFVDTVDKMQGQQSHCVIVSYGVSDVETALGEAEFIYSLNRINVSVSRARSKCIVFLPRPLLEPSFDVLQNQNAVKGLEHMHALLDFCSRRGEEREISLDLLKDGNGGVLTALRAK